MASAHVAVKQELLVRCLDAWLPAALHGHRRVCLVCATSSADLLGAALGVVTELGDLVAGRELTIVATLPLPAPPGISVTQTWSARLGVPFAFLDGAADLSEPVAAVRGAEVLLFTPGPLDGTPALTTPYVCLVGLVAGGGAQETLAFGAWTEKALEKFKDELWALDEFAGVQLRDPGDAELLDISLVPHPGPLRRMLAARLGAHGEATVADLRDWTLRHTIFRPEDTTRALHAMVATREVHRSPTSGRLTPATVVTLGTGR